MSFLKEADRSLGSDVAMNEVEVAEYPTDYEDIAFEEETDFRALGIDPESPTNAKPGSEAKVLMLAARYAAGLPLWHQEDCYDHGPNLQAEFMDFYIDDEEEED